MDDQDLEARLRAYRPAAPPHELRARVDVARRLQPNDRSTLAWLPAVAAMLLATIFYWLAANERRMLDARLPAIPPIEQAMRALSPEQREVVHLKVFEGWTFQEIADFGGESINTVASRYRYAMDKMRDQLS